MYRERPAAGGPELAGAVLWSSTRVPGAGPARVLPDGCVDLLWSSVGGLLVAGPDTAAHLSTGPAGERYVGLRLPPGTGPVVLGVPAHELRDRRVPLGELWPDRLVAELADRAAGGAPGGVLEEVAGARLRAAGGPDPFAGLVARSLSAGRPVAAVADHLGLGVRQLHRRSRQMFGYGPKTLDRILRLRRALALVRAGVPAAEVAARTGYADQPHLSREVRALAGVPLGRLIGPRSRGAASPPVSGEPGRR